MPLLNYTTTVDPAKTAADIQWMLSKHGADEVSTAYENGIPTGIAFIVKTQWGKRAFRVPANPAGALKAMERDRVQPRYLTAEHSRRVAWRILKDWLEVQLALVKVGMASLDEILMPYMLDPASGRQVVEIYREQQARLALESGDQ